MKSWNIQLKESDRRIFDVAKWDGFTVLRHERCTDGNYVTENSRIPNVFLSDGQLYHPCFSQFTTTVISLIKLNMDKQDKSCGVFFEVH